MRNIAYCNNTSLSIQKTLDKSILTQEFVSYNTYQLQDYVLDRLSVMETVIKLRLHEDDMYVMNEVARDFLYCCLQQIETVYPLVEEELGQYVIKKIQDIQKLFLKRMQ
jgi:hypothetical protein